MKIRQYQSNDLEAVLNVWESASHVGHPFLSKDFLQSERMNIPKVYLPSGDAWVALKQGKVVGFMILHDNEVGALFVHPEFHGQGVGTTLMNKASEMHEQLTVEVFKDNTVGNKFYIKYGFVFCREHLHEDTAMMMLCLQYSIARDHKIN